MFAGRCRSVVQNHVTKEERGVSCYFSKACNLRDVPSRLMLLSIDRPPLSNVPPALTVRTLLPHASCELNLVARVYGGRFCFSSELHYAGYTKLPIAGLGDGLVSCVGRLAASLLGCKVRNQESE